MTNKYGIFSDEKTEQNWEPQKHERDRCRMSWRGSRRQEDLEKHDVHCGEGNNTLAAKALGI